MMNEQSAGSKLNSNVELSFGSAFPCTWNLCRQFLAAMAPSSLMNTAVKNLTNFRGSQRELLEGYKLSTHGRMLHQRYIIAITARVKHFNVHHAVTSHIIFVSGFRFERLAHKQIQFKAGAITRQIKHSVISFCSPQVCQYCRPFFVLFF